MKNPQRIRRQIPLVLVGSVAVLIAAQSAQAASATWEASPASATWSASNWTGGAGTGGIPASGDALVFGASTQTTLTNDLTTGTAWVIPSITFSAGAPAYVISGGAFTLGASAGATVLNNASTSLQTLNSDFTLGNAADQAVVMSAGGGDISLGGTISSAGSNSGLWVQGNGTLSIKGSATVANQFNVGNTSTVKVDGGSLSVNAWGNGNQATGAVQVTNGGSFSAALLYTNNHTLIQDSGTVTLGATSADLLQQLFYTATGGTALIQGSVYNGLNLDAGGTANITYVPVQTLSNGGSANGSLSVGGNAAVTFAGGLNLAGGTGTGTVNLNGGTLTVSSIFKSVDATTATVNFNGGALRFSAPSIVASSSKTTFNVLGGGAVIDTQANSVTIAQALVSGTANDGGLIKNGSGMLTLSGSNTYTGDTVINSGTLNAQGAYSLQNSTLNYNNQGGTLVFSTPAGQTAYLGGLKGSQNLALGVPGSWMILSVGANNQDTTFSGVLSGSGGLTKTGTGTLTLTAANTYTQNTRINGGTLSVASSSSLGGATSNLYFGGGTLKITGDTAFSTSKLITLDASTTSTIDVSNSAGATLNTIGGSGNLIKTGTGTLTLATANNNYTWTGTTLINSGTVVLGHGSALASTFDTSGAGTLSFGSLTSVNLGGLMGTGTLNIPTGVTLSANPNTSSAVVFAGSLTGAGNLTVGNQNSSGNKLAVYTGTSSISGGFNVGTGGTLQINGGSFSTSANWGNGGNGTVQVTNGGSFSIGTSMWGARHYVIQDSGFVSIGTSASDIDQYLNLITTGGTATLKGNLYQGLNIDASGSAVVNITAAQALVTFDAANNGWLKVGGNAAVNLSGTLDLANTTASGTIALNGGVLTLPGLKKTNTTSVTTVNFNSGTLRLSAASTLPNTVNTTFNVLSGGAVIDTQANAVTLAQALVSGTTDDGGLKKLGTGKLTLSAVNTYTGATTIASGTLALASTGSIDNSSTIVVGNAGSSGAVLDLTAKSSYNILSGQTLKGIGSLNIGAGKTITVNSGAHWAPGNSIGTNSVTGNLALAGVADIELGTANAVAASSVNDQTTVNGTLGLGGTLNLIDNAGANGQGVAGAGQYQIFSGFTGTASGSFSAVNNINGYHAKVDAGTAGAVYVNNYQIAASNTLAPTVNLGITHVGKSFTSSTLSIQNTAASNGYAEGLNATKGATTGAAVLGGSDISNLAGGATSTAITVGLNDTATAGVKTGTATVGFASNGAISGYENTALTDQTLTVNGQVNYYADPTFTQGTGGTLTSIDTTHFTLNLGTFDKDTGIYTATISLGNILHDATYQDLLAGGFDVSGAGAFSLDGFAATLSELASGSSLLLTVSFNTAGATVGSYTGTVLFNPTSVNTSGTEALSQVNLGLTFEVTQVPEPATWSMIVGGLGMMAFVQRARRRMSR